MNRILWQGLGLAAALLAGGCNNNDSISAKDASVSEVAEKVANSDVRPNPGRWETTITMDGKSISTLPGGRALATCLTDADIDKMGEKMIGETQENCRYERFEMVGGKVSGVMRCGAPGPEVTTTMSGTYNDQTYVMDVDTTIAIGGKSQSTKMNIASRRVGECNGTEG